MAAEAPVNVQAVCVGRDAFDISWERPPAAQGEEDLVSYSFGVFVKEASEDKFTLVYQTKDDDEATHTFRCVDLKEATKYEAYVQSFGIFSEGDCSVRSPTDYLLCSSMKHSVYSSQKLPKRKSPPQN
eukprot:m.1361361 g.1361361  ORF g.1361361 m.1361361 type:complete len:128 (-) comp24942_c1_seq2:3745-4128(-)